MPHLQALHWDYQDQLTEVELNGTGDRAYYNYDGGGQRVRKVVVKSGRRTERLYLGGVERYREYSATTVNHPNGIVELERWTVQIDDIAQVDTLTVDNSATVASLIPLIRYQYRNHLGSATMETNENGEVISYEEYHPFGTSAYRTAKSNTDLSLKRYRFTNKERDDETGLYYFGVRYYAAWLGRWTSSDPGDFVDGLNMYVYVRNNPVVLVDKEGYEGEPATEESTPGPEHWVKKKSDIAGKSIVYWDDNAIDQQSTKDGEEYLGEYYFHVDPDGSTYTFLPNKMKAAYGAEIIPKTYASTESIEGEAAPQTYAEYQGQHSEFSSMNHTEAKNYWNKKYSGIYIPPLIDGESKIIDDFRFLAKSTLKAGAFTAKVYGAALALIYTGGFAFFGTTTTTTGAGLTIPTLLVAPMVVDGGWQLGTSSRWNPAQSVAMGVFKNPGAAMAVGQLFPVSFGRGGIKYEGYDVNKSVSLISGAALFGKASSAMGNFIGGNISPRLANNALGKFISPCLPSPSVLPSEKTAITIFTKYITPLLGNAGADGLGVEIARQPGIFYGGVNIAPVEGWK